MDTGVKVTQLRMPATLYERMKERAHEERQSHNKIMCKLIEMGLECKEVRK
jgi:predicted DNA-binding protein